MDTIFIPDACVSRRKLKQRGKETFCPMSRAKYKGIFRGPVLPSFMTLTVTIFVALEPRSDRMHSCLAFSARAKDNRAQEGIRLFLIPLPDAFATSLQAVLLL